MVASRLGIIMPGLSITSQGGFDGLAANQDFAYNQSASTFGVLVNDDPGVGGAEDLSFAIMDLDGNALNVVFPAGDGNTGAGFHTLTSIVNEINDQASANGVKIMAEVLTVSQTIRISSTIPGKSGRVTMSEGTNMIGVPASAANTLKSILNVDSKTYSNGYGDYAYTMHVKDSFIQFQIGPNQGHTAKANIIRTDCKALGIEDLDLTNIRVAEEAIGLIDKALNRISSERAKLGAIENRMTYTLNSLRVGLENMSASESRIRDLDMASEVISMTKYQILQQSSNAMLAQANTSSQRVLDLLR